MLERRRRIGELQSNCREIFEACARLSGNNYSSVLDHSSLSVTRHSTVTLTHSSIPTTCTVNRYNIVQYVYHLYVVLLYDDHVETRTSKKYERNVFGAVAV